MTMPAAVQVVWWIALIVTLVVFVPLAVYAALASLGALSIAGVDQRKVVRRARNRRRHARVHPPAQQHHRFGPLGHWLSSTVPREVGFNSRDWLQELDRVTPTYRASA